MADPAGETPDTGAVGLPFGDKLAALDWHAEDAVGHLVDWLLREGNLLTVIACGRLAEGHYRYGDRLLFELSPDELAANAAQELADAIVYVARRLEISEGT